VVNGRGKFRLPNTGFSDPICTPYQSFGRDLRRLQHRRHNLGDFVYSRCERSGGRNHILLGSASVIFHQRRVRDLVEHVLFRDWRH
jgi:hypothetical protein